MNYGVSNVNRSESGTSYIITDAESRLIGKVEVTHGLAGGDLSHVRNRWGEPEPVGSTRYEDMLTAVKAYKLWADQHEGRKP